MPQLIRLYIQQILIGFALSAAFVLLLLYLNVAGLGTLVATSPDGPLGMFLLFFFNGLVFAGVQFAIAIMRMADPDDGGPGGGLSDRGGHADPDAHQPVVIPVKDKVAGPQRPDRA